MKDYLHEVLIVRLDLDRSRDSDIQAILVSQITREQELNLMDTCYNPCLLVGLVSVVKLNVVCGYTYSAQVETRANNALQGDMLDENEQHQMDIGLVMCWMQPQHRFLVNFVSALLPSYR